MTKYLRAARDGHALTVGAITITDDVDTSVTDADAVTLQAQAVAAGELLLVSDTPSPSTPPGATIDPSLVGIRLSDLDDSASPASLRLAAAYARRWQPSTAYAVGDVVTAPDGARVKRLSAGTSGTSYTAANWQPLDAPALSVYDGTVVAANNSRLDWGHGATSGYFLHLHTEGASPTGTGALIGMGVGDGTGAGQTVGTTGLLISQKASSIGAGIALVNQGGTLGRMLSGTHVGTAGTEPFFFLETANTSGTATPLIKMVGNGTPAAGQIMQEWNFPQRAGGASNGRVMADTGELKWETAAVRNRYGQIISDDGTGTQVALRSGKFTHDPAVEMVRYAGTGGSGYGGRVTMNNSELRIEVAAHAALGSHVYDAVAIRTGRAGAAAASVGFYGVAPVARAGAIASPTAPSATYVQAEVASLKTAVDAIRTALTNVGLTA